MNAYYLGLVLHNRIMVWFGNKKIFHSFHLTVASQQEGRRFSCDTGVCVYSYLPHTDFLCGNLWTTLDGINFRNNSHESSNGERK